MRGFRAYSSGMEDSDSKATIKAEVKQVTPAMAEKWLKKNHPKNRKVSWNRVTSFANDMRDGKWELTHQGVCFDKEGFLIDGQHRLYAVIEAKTSVDMFVVHNSRGNIDQPIDHGFVRNLSFLTGYPPKTLTAINVLRMLGLGSQSGVPMTKAEAEHIHSLHKDAFEAIESCKSFNHQKMNGAAVGACVYAFPINGPKTLDFIEKVLHGEMIKRGDPAFSFRHWRERNPRATTWEIAMATLNCLRHHLQDQQLKTVYTVTMGYQATTSKRRAMRIPNTPPTSIVTGVSWTRTPDEDKDH